MTNQTTPTAGAAVAVPLQRQVRPDFTIDVVFGTVEFEERLIFDGNRMGYECRKVRKDRSGVVIDIGPWNPPLCWLVFPEPEPARRPWWARLFGAA